MNTLFLCDQLGCPEIDLQTCCTMATIVDMEDNSQSVH